MDSMQLELPWPPSVNNYWRHGKGRVYVSDKGVAYRADVWGRILEQHGRTPSRTGRVAVDIECFPPDRRKRDLDNLNKCLLDALTYCSVWDDDSQIDRLVMTRHHTTIPGGRLVVTISDWKDEKEEPRT